MSNYSDELINNYNCPDCNDAKLQSDKNARKINEVIDQVNALIQVNNETVDFIEEKVDEIVNEVIADKINIIKDNLQQGLNSTKDNETLIINSRFTGEQFILKDKNNITIIGSCDIMQNTIYTPIIVLTYFLILLSGKSISTIVTTISETINSPAQLLINSIICTSSHYSKFSLPRLLLLLTYLKAHIILQIII